ncbi:MAG: ABC transporter permease [Acidimicrobiia bacterium]|nr:ABC transporter permease [Acidimicrobiia bacterium]MYB24651.1 ABC transporter permease [Acidimicrobiia bacterium]MYE66619.1 ABC transporter permease [Acidimicrobiia bacterium]
MALGGSSALVYAFFYLPVIVLIVFSFNKARTGGAWTGFTTNWYSLLAQNDQIKTATVNSVVVAIIATSVATVLGTMISLALDRHTFRGRKAAQQVVYLPVIAPEIVTGVSLLAFFSLALGRLNDILGRGAEDAIRLGRPTVILTHIAFCTAFVALVVRASLRTLDPAIEEAAADLGAGAWTTFRRVTLPSIMPGVLGGALLSFTLSLDNFVITFYVAGPGATTLPIEVYGQLRRAISPEVNAVSTLIFAASSLLLLSALGVQAGVARRRLQQVRPAKQGPEPNQPITDPNPTPIPQRRGQ